MSNTITSSSARCAGPLVRAPAADAGLTVVWDDSARPSVLRGIASYIIANEFCERLAFYGFSGSLVLFFQTKMGMTNAQADIQYSAWNGACYVTPLIGGYIADTYLGRSKTILAFSLIYCAGLMMVVAGAVPSLELPGLVFAAIYVIAFGTGGIKPNVSTLGADQFDERYEKDRTEKASFFNWFYWSVNLGAMISYTLITYICTFGIPQLGGEPWGFFVGYTIPCLSMIVAIFIFVSGFKKYKKMPPTGSVLSRSAGIVWFSMCSAASGTVTDPSAEFVDRASTVNGGPYAQADVSAVKMLLRIVPFMLVLIPFWGIYGQTSTAFQNQACQMQLDIGGGVNIPPAALNVFDSMAVLLLVPLFDRHLYPAVEKFRGSGKPLTMLQKIGWGFMFALLSMIAAALVEEYRLAESPDQAWYDDPAARENISPCHDIDDYNPYRYQQWEAGLGVDEQPSECGTVPDCAAPLYYYDAELDARVLNMTCISCEDIPQMSDISVFWQIPQFALIGTAEILAAVTALEFFYSEAPESMKSVAQALNLFMNALGMWTTIPIVIFVNTVPSKPWLPENLDDGKLTYYFLLLGGLMCINLVFFFWLSSKYHYVNKTLTEQSGRPGNASSMSENNNEGSSFNGMRGGMSYSYLGSRRKSLISRGLDDSTGSNGSDSITVHLNEAPISQDLGQIEDDDVHSDSSSPVARRIINNFGRKKKAFMHLATDEDISSPIQTGNNPLVIAALQFEKIVGDKHDMEIEMTNAFQNEAR